jgi:sortase A
MTVRIHLAADAPRGMVRAVLLAIGIACLGLYCGVWLQRILYQNYESEEFDRASDRSAVARQVSQEESPARLEHRSASVFRPAQPGVVIGRLSVGRLKLSAMVREGIDHKTLRLAIGHIPGTALPGHAGNVGVAGHRDTLFRGLKDLKTGDEIRFSTLDGEFDYIVESLRIVEPSYVGVLAASSENVLTLVTCYPFSYLGNAPKRFIVRAKQVSPPIME